MRIRHQVALVVACAAMAASALAPIGKPVALALSYTYPCNIFATHTQMAVVARGAGATWQGGTGNDYKGIIGDARVSATLPCTGSADGRFSAVIPANLQADQTRIVQLGWMVCDGSTADKCGHLALGVPSDGQLHFFYVCEDNSGGEICLADGWAGMPVPGHRYRFRIEHSGSNWLYSLKDLTMGTAAVTAAIDRTFEFGNLIWWGAETTNKASMMGSGQAGGSMLHMYWMQYLRQSIPAGWQVAEPTQTWYLSPPGIAWPTYWDSDNYSQNYVDDAQNIWTQSH